MQCICAKCWWIYQNTLLIDPYYETRGAVYWVEPITTSQKGNPEVWRIESYLRYFNIIYVLLQLLCLLLAF